MKKSCLTGNGCKFIRVENLYETQFYCKARRKYLYLEDTTNKHCKYYKEIENV